MGPIAFGGEVRGEFLEDEQLDGYVFSARAGARITLDNSNLGTTRALDSMLFLYGPVNAEGFYGATPIASDDDSGWGLHARIKEFTLPAGGEYLAVLGTYAGLDRGRYRLALICAGESCVETCPDGCDDGKPDTSDRCDPGLGCVHQSTGAIDDALVMVEVADQLLTSEAREMATFSVRITAPPTETVIIWVDTSDPTEGVAYPTKLLFCKPGFHIGGSSCKENTEEEPGDPDEWKRTIPVRVFGVRDAEPDGDVAYHLLFQVQTTDPIYGEATLADIPCVNQHVATTLDTSALEGLEDDALLQALYQRLKGNITYDYLGQNSARTFMFSTIENIDNQTESIYTGQKISRALDAQIAYQAGFNTEHTWPQSQFDKLEPMKSDLHHIFPSDISSNGLRSSYDFGWVSTGESFRSRLGTSITDARKRVFQVRPQMRGDVARAHFYMVARYKFDLEIGIRFDDDSSASNGCIKDSEESVLREWNAQDPVDDRERARNDRVEAYQGTRNPFIDDASLVERVLDF
ncbi:MAG: endonuclease [Deltaproteobacteria bacterium]|nr:endonuclease [Deltaproteobacteria bacterium]